MEDELNLRKYIDVLVRQWKLIITITVIAVFITGLLSFLIPPTYEARVEVLMTKAKSEITFDPEYRTIFDETDTSMRKALVALVKSDSIATGVIAQLGDRLKPEEQKKSNLLGKVQVMEHGNLITILVNSVDPQKAADIANAWANFYQNYANRLYSGIFRSAEEIQTQTDSARNEYEITQKTLENFISNNRIDELRRQIDDKKLLLQVKSLREQVKAGSSSSASTAANSLSFILLQSSAFANLPDDLQLSLDSLSNIKPILADIDALISTLEMRSGGTQEQSTSELQQEINQLKAYLEEDSARQRELENSRNIAWETLVTLERKTDEATIAAQIQSTSVRIAGVASVPDSPVAPHKIMNIAIALVIGLIVGIFSAFGYEYFRNKETPDKSKEA